MWAQKVSFSFSLGKLTDLCIMVIIRAAPNCPSKWTEVIQNYLYIQRARPYVVRPVDCPVCRISNDNLGWIAVYRIARALGRAVLYPSWASSHPHTSQTSHRKPLFGSRSTADTPPPLPSMSNSASSYGHFVVVRVLASRR
jgi:hypothetical protein